MPVLRRIIRTLITCAIAVTVTLGLFFAGNTIYNHLQSEKTRKQQEELGQLYQGDSAPDPEDGQESVNPRLAKSYAINPDLVAWLELGNGELAVPVVQRDNQYYLKHDFYGEESNHGTVFLDYRNHLDPNDDNLIIYGHNMNDNTMFSILAKYREPDYIAQNPVILLDTLHGEDKQGYVVCSVFLAATLPQHNFPFDYHNRVEFQTLEDKEEYLEEIARRSLVDTGVEATTRDRFITLSTCLYDFSGERLAVVARELREGESAADFEGLTVTRRADPVMPDIWNQLYAAK